MPIVPSQDVGMSMVHTPTKTRKQKHILIIYSHMQFISLNIQIKKFIKNNFNEGERKIKKKGS